LDERRALHRPRPRPTTASPQRQRRLAGDARAAGRHYAYDQATASLYFLAHGTLMRARGSRSQRLWPLARLGLFPGRNLQLQPLGRLVALRDQHRLVVLRTDGSLFAATRLPDGRARTDGISSSITAAPGERAVAFTATRDDTHGSPGTETVYLLW